jgi:CBS domain containing-hemolysin-like protein
VAAIGLSVTWLTLTSFTGGKARRLEAQNRDLAERLEPWLAKRDEYRVLLRLLLLLDCCLLFFCYAAWDLACQNAAASYAVRFGVPGAIALLFFAFSELLGRHLSAINGARLLAALMPVVWCLGIVFFPLTLIISLSHRWAESLHEARSDEHGKATAEDEIMSLIERDEDDEDSGNADLEDDERRMIRGVFDLDETLVHEIMTPRVDVDAIEEDATLAEVKEKIVSTGHSRIPVYRESIDHVVGVVYAKDLLDDSLLDASGGLGSLPHSPFFIPETKNVGDLLEEFQQSRNHFAVVLDEYGGTAGLVTFEDILEEIVGEIQDEYDVDEVQPVSTELPDGCHVVDARLTIDEVNDLLEVDLSEDEAYDTLAGYIAAYCGHIPQKGETGMTDVLEFEILEADQRRVEKLKVRKLDEDGQDDA